MIWVKAGVKPYRLLMLAAYVANVAEALGLDVTITSAMDGTHMQGSKHYTGEALDLRISNLTKDQREDLLAGLRDRMGKSYDVVLEKDHIHVEYDPA